MESNTALLDEVIGHTHRKQQLKALVERGRVPHALLFSGPAGSGKRTLARAFAAYLLSQRQVIEGSSPITLVRNGTHPDLHFLHREQGKKDISVDGVRTLCHALQLKPYCSSCVVAIIDNAHLMNLAASNALLTTLEEPPDGGYLILITDSQQRLPATIVSRCQAFYFGELAETELDTLFAAVVLPLLDGNQALKTQLRELLGGTLGNLNLDSFFDARTLRPNSPKELVQHLRFLAEESKRLRSRIRDLLEVGTSADAVLLASELGAEKEGLGLLWQTLQTEIRAQLLNPKRGSRELWADLLLASLERERLSQERSLNAPIQLSDLLVRATTASRA